MNVNKLYDINNFHEINSEIIRFLLAIYPTKSSSDFRESNKTSNVKFITSGLSVDIVPVIEINPSEINNLHDYVRQPDSETNQFYVTSVKEQINFIIDIKQRNSSFTAVVRILKYWKYINSLSLSSFTIELIVAYLDLTKGVTTNIEEEVIRFFNFISRKKLSLITFNAPYGEVNTHGSYVYVADPTNNNNNSAKYLSEIDWRVIRLEAEKALDTLVYAQVSKSSSNTIDLWVEVFGSGFNITPII